MQGILVLRVYAGTPACIVLIPVIGRRNNHTQKIVLCVPASFDGAVPDRCCCLFLVWGFPFGVSGCVHVWDNLLDV